MEGYGLVERAPSANGYRRLRDTAGWGAMTDEALSTGLSNGMIRVW